MIRKKKLYEKPRKLYELARIKEENDLVKQYGLKSKTEVWKSLSKVNYFRQRAKALAKRPIEEQEIFFRKLRATGLNVNNISDVLNLKISDILNRRLASVVAKNKLAHTVKEARQMIVHKKILLNGRVVNSPSFLVPIELEKSIFIKGKNKTQSTEKK